MNLNFAADVHRPESGHPDWKQIDEQTYPHANILEQPKNISIRKPNYPAIAFSIMGACVLVMAIMWLIQAYLLHFGIRLPIWHLATAFAACPILGTLLAIVKRKARHWGVYVATLLAVSAALFCAVQLWM